MTRLGRRAEPVRRLLAALLLLVAVVPGCAQSSVAIPYCEPGQRLAIVAQSVPTAAYVPCITDLPEGWTLRSLDVDSRGMSLSLSSDRAERPVRVSLVPTCDPTDATPVAPRAAGVRTLQHLTAISPRYAGQLFDVFPGGCVVYDFDFARGPHIPLTEQLLASVDLYPRLQLRQEVGDDLGVTFRG